MRHVFIFDTGYFREQQWKMDSIYDNIGQYFRTQTRPEFTTHTPHYPRQTIGIIQEQADKAVDNDTIRVYAIGGDEIFFDCLNSVAGLPNSELALVTSGNTSDFMRIFGLVKADITKDIQSLTTSPSIPADLISVDNWYVLNGCCIGFAAADAKRKKDLRTGKKVNWLARIYRLFLASINSLFMVYNKKIIAQKYRVTIDGKDYSGTYSHISIVNGPYYGNGKIAAPNAKPDDGLLDIALLKTTRPLLTLLSLNKFSHGKTPSNCTVMQAKKINVQTDEPVWIQMDGAFIQDTNITFEILPEAVKIVHTKNTSHTDSKKKKGKGH